MSKCENCIHYDACKKISDVHGLTFGSAAFCNHFKDKSLFVELPCKVRDTVYIIDEADDECGEDYVLAVKVLNFFINEHGIAVNLALPLGMRLNTWMVVGKTVFLTKEEAEQKLKELREQK